MEYKNKVLLRREKSRNSNFNFTTTARYDFKGLEPQRTSTSFFVFIYSTFSLQGIRKIKFTHMKIPNFCYKAQFLSIVRVK